MEPEVQPLPFDVIKAILLFIPEHKRYFCSTVCKTWLTWVDSSITSLDLSKKNILEIFSLHFDNRIIFANAEKISRAEKVLMTAARRFTNLKKIKIGAEAKSVRNTYIAYPSKLGMDRFDAERHPLGESFAKKRALENLAVILQDVNKAVNRHQEFQTGLQWSEFSLKRARDDIDPLILVHLIKNCRKLVELQLYGITRVTDDILAVSPSFSSEFPNFSKAIVDLRPNITQLNLVNTSVSVIGLEYALKNLPNLEKLSIGRTVSSGYLLCSPHKNFPTTEMLKLKDLPAWKNLRKLRISYTSTQDMTPLFLACTNLEKFHIAGANATLLPFKPPFVKLKILDISANSDVARLIANHPQLEDVTLRGFVENAHLIAIANCVVKLKKLRVSVFYDCQISDAALRGVIEKHAKTLESLELCEIRTISPNAIDLRLPALKTLVLKKCNNISGKDLAKFVPRSTKIAYQHCIDELLEMDFSKLISEGVCFKPFQYRDKNGFCLRTQIGSPFDPADW